MKSFWRPSRPLAVQRGFSLIELSMVLVIIGLVVSAVSIGMNMQRSSQHQSIKQKFVDQWVSAYNEFYMRAGIVPGDSTATPTFAVNAAADPDTLAALLAVVDSDYSAFDLDPLLDFPARLCEGSANDLYQGPSGEGVRESDTTSMRDLFVALGVRMPPGRAEGQEDRYIYLDSNGNPQEIQICFQWNPPGTVSGSGNVMVLKGLTPELARMLDRMIDGQVNALAGAFREQGRESAADTDGFGNACGNEWCVDNRYRFNEPNDPGLRDENMVITVTAHYRMNQ